MRLVQGISVKNDWKSLKKVFDTQLTLFTGSKSGKIFKKKIIKEEPIEKYDKYDDSDYEHEPGEIIDMDETWEEGELKLDENDDLSKTSIDKYIIKEDGSHHKCKLCNRTFSQSGTLRRHIKTVHGGVKSHNCETCGKSFSRAANLKKHISAVHEGTKDHKCHICFKEFRYGSCAYQ